MKIFKKTLCIALALAMLMGNINPPFNITSYAAPVANQPKDIGYLEELLKKKTAPYDVMIKFSNAGLEALSLEERADIAQKEAIELIEDAYKRGEVEKYDSFYISNAIHIVTGSKELLESLAKLERVEKITENSRVELINPVEKEKKRRTQRSAIYTPDERDIEWGVIDVHADKVWEEFGIDGSGITVGIIDTGVNYNLPAIKKSFLDYDSASGTIKNKVDNPATKQWEGPSYRDFIDNISFPESSEANDHGTHVAGTILGQQSSSVNRIGVAPGAKFISARAIGPDGGEVADLLAAAQWMLEMKPDVVNNSWGGPNDNDEWFKDIINAWNNAGIIPVFAAGNTASKVPGLGSISNPGNYLDVISVAAVDQNKQIGRFSNKGPSAFDSSKSIIKPEISAPGVQVRSIDARGNYVSWNGTSMASPHVAGVIALIKEAAKKAGKEEDFDSLDEIRALITSTAEPLSDNTYTQSPNMAYGYGLINAYDAVAKVMEDRVQGEISGVVLKDGADTRVPNLEINVQDEAYIGRKFKVEAKVDDDVSIREVKLSYYIGSDSSNAVEHELNLTDGVQNNGTYAYSIEADKLSQGTLHLSVTTKDYAENVVTKQKDVEIKSGMTLPWESDLEQTSSLNGFVLEGTWAVSTKKSTSEPDLPAAKGGGTNTTYVGTNAGSGVFEKRVDSYLYLPPIDLSTTTGNPSLSVDMYNGFTGLSQAKLQASFTGNENDWEDIYQVVLRPDITQRQWVHNSYSLAKYIGNAKPLQLRFYFYGHNADEGAGWYLDNFAIKQQEDTPPAQVQALRASLGQKGVNLSFVANEETDMSSYTIERKEEGAATFTAIATIPQKLSDFTFINKNEDPTRPSSHYRVNYYDKNLTAGKKYIYRVRALDNSGNYSEYSKELSVDYSSYTETVFYDFEADNGGFTTGVLSGNINDWQWGKPVRPSNEDYTKLLPRETWEGLEKNPTKVWGTNLNGKYRKNQDSYIQMPSVTVKDGDYLYFDSFNAQMSLDTALSLTVEIKEKNKTTWSQLVSRETIMDGNQIRVWQQIGADLSEYKNKTVDIRFHIQVGQNIYIDSYNIGWYIDNVVVGDKEQKFKTDRLRVFTNDEYATPSNAFDLASDSDAREEESSLKDVDVSQSSSIELDMGSTTGYYTAGSVPIPGGFPSNAYIPLRARVKVLDTGKYAYASEIDGSFSINHAINKADKKYRLEFSAYGYESKIVEVDLRSGTHKINIPTVVLNKAKSASVKGIVKDAAGNPLDGVNVRVVEDDLVPVISTDGSGNYTSSSIYEGRYTFRFYKEGYYSIEKEVTLSAGENVLDEVRLTPLGNLNTEKIDYGYNVKAGADGNYQTVHFTSGMKGVAVRFQSPYKGGILKSAELFLVKNKYYSGEHIMIGVLAYDENRRLREIVPFREYENVTPNAWNTIDFSEFTIKTDKPIYIATMYTKNLENSIGVYYDTSVNSNAKEHSYVYDGAFTKTSNVTPSGAFAVKSDWLYEAGAQRNPESDDESGGSKPEDPEIIDDTEESFVFDIASQTITAYKGKNTSVVVPAAIGGVAVKKIGAQAFIGTSKTDNKLRKVIISEGIEEIAEEAFKNNNLSEIVLPQSLTAIGQGAFMNQYKDDFDDKSLKINLPSNITRIEKDTFAFAGNPVIAELPSVSYIAAGAFNGIKDTEVNAPNLQTIEDGAFGKFDRVDFNYAKVFTALDTSLVSKDREYVINPALVNVSMINARDHEDVLLKKVHYGESGLQNIGRNVEASKIYRIGDTVTIKAPRLTRKNIAYISDTPDISLKLEKTNDINFYYYLQEVRSRLPILDSDKELVGFALPNSDIKAKVGTKLYEAKANEDGFFKIEGVELNPSDKVEFTANNYEAGKFNVEQKNSNEDYIIEGTVLKRYTGNGGDVVLPISGSGGAIKEIGDFAFYDKSLINVTLPDAVETIGSGAFMDTGLSSFGWRLNDINQSKLRTVNEYAFKNNSLSKVYLPELTHVIRTSAFENNDIEELKLGKYTGHVGDKAFKDNSLKEVELADVAEEIGVGAFMNNKIEKLIVKPWLEGYEHGLDLIPDYAFANNKLSEVSLPTEITYVSELAFAGNTSGRFIIASDATQIVPTKAYDVRRSNGELLKWSDKPKEDNNSGNNGANNNSGSNDSGNNNSGSNNNTNNNGNTDNSNSSNNNSNANNNSNNNTTPERPNNNRPSNNKGSYSGGGSGGSGGSGSGGFGGRRAGSGSASSSALPAGYTGATKTIGRYTVPASVDKGTWQKDAQSGRWKYTDSNGNPRPSAWVEVFNEGLVQKQQSKLPFAWYSFDENANMRTGWFTDDKNRTYYFSEAQDETEGAMLTGWQLINGKWYYLNTAYGQDMGLMLSNTTTPDGYRLLSDGSWDGVNK